MSDRRTPGERLYDALGSYARDIPRSLLERSASAVLAPQIARTVELEDSARVSVEATRDVSIGDLMKNERLAKAAIALDKILPPKEEHVR